MTVVLLVEGILVVGVVIVVVVMGVYGDGSFVGMKKRPDSRCFHTS